MHKIRSKYSNNIIDNEGIIENKVEHSIIKINALNQVRPVSGKS